MTFSDIFKSSFLESVKEFSAVDTLVGPWELPGETTTPKYSAVAYFTAEQLHKALGVPIGIIHSSLGGSKVQVWTSREALVAGGEDPNETFRGKTSTYLFNGMVYPLRNASFRSVLWFQGEQNMDDAEKYDKLYALMTDSSTYEGEVFHVAGTVRKIHTADDPDGKNWLTVDLDGNSLRPAYILYDNPSKSTGYQRNDPGCKTRRFSASGRC